jgi:hypothetical protein
MDGPGACAATACRSTGLSSAMGKTGARTRVDAARIAERKGWL